MPGCETKEDWKEIRCRRTDPGQYQRFTRKSVGNGVSFVLGWKDGKSEVQSVRFTKSKGWTLEKARQWIKNHPKLEAYSSGNAKHLSSMAFNYNKIVKNADGTVTFKDAVLLAEGTWRDVASGMTVFYGADVIGRDWKNWESDIYTLDHGHSPLDIIGTVSNRRFVDDRIIGDITFHCGTEPSRDAAWLAENGLVNGNSVEVMTHDVWDQKINAYRADMMEFLRVSLVIDPACSTCRLSACPLPEGSDDLEDEELTKELGGDDMGEEDKPCPEEQKKLEEKAAKAEELEKKLTDTETQLKATEQKVEELSKNYDQIKSDAEAKEKEISGLKAEVEELKKEPVHRTGAGGPSGEEEAEYSSDIEIRDGEITRKE